MKNKTCLFKFRVLTSFAQPYTVIFPFHMHKQPQSTLTLLEPFCFEGSNGHVRGTSGITNAPHTTAEALKLEPVMIGASTNDQH